MNNKELKYFLYIMWTYFFIQVLSGLKVIFFFNSEDSFLQYFKIILSNGTFTVFTTFFYVFLSNIGREERYRILLFYIAGVVLSSVYGFLGSFLYINYGIRIENYVWNYLSYYPDNSFVERDITWTVLGIRRGYGFPGVNAAATYNATILPLLLLFVLYRRSIKDYIIFCICFIGLLVTISRTGFLAFSVSLLIVFIISFKTIKRPFITLLIIAAPFLLAGYYWWDYIIEITQARPLKDVERLMQWESGLFLFSNNFLLGVGANNFSVVRWSLPSYFYHDENLHNSWLTILVELGLLGLICYLIFLAFIVWRIYKSYDIISRGFLCAIIGLSVAAFSNQLFDIFYFKFFIILMFSMVAMRDGYVFRSGHNRNANLLTAEGKT